MNTLRLSAHEQFFQFICACILIVIIVVGCSLVCDWLNRVRDRILYRNGYRYGVLHFQGGGTEEDLHKYMQEALDFDTHGSFEKGVAQAIKERNNHEGE
jgi:uncharacterized protein YebE (UPF0316 family)